MTKIDIISGFLGAGKTTLIKKLMKETLYNEKIVLIENEFGEIGIDGGFLEDAGIEIKEMNSGCICCSLVGDFSIALQKVLEEYHPDRIIIEPSGVGKLSDVIKAVEDMHHQKIQINSITTVADAQKCKMYMKNFGEFFNNQIEYAHVIILSRTQFVSADKIEEVVHMVKQHNEHARIITTPWETLQGVDIVEAMQQDHQLEKELLEEMEVCPTCGHHHHHEKHEHYHDEHEHHDHDGCSCGHDHHDHHDHHADDVFTSWGSETPRKYSKEELDHILMSLSNDHQYGTILRAKGMLEDVNGTWMYFDYVPEECEIREGKPTYTGRFCVIGSHINIDKLKALFQVA